MAARAQKDCLTLHDLLLRFQRQQRFTALQLGVPPDQVGAQLGHTEDSVLFIVDAEPGKSVKELAELLVLERSWMSRIVSGLETKKFIKSEGHPTDRRSKLVHITPKGRLVLERAEVVVKQTTDRCLTPLSLHARNTFEERLRQLADCLGAHHYEQHRSGHPVAYQLGRISAASGALGKSLFGSTLNVTQAQILMVLSEFGERAAQISDVTRLVPFDMSTVSRTLQNFEEQGWIHKQRSPRDKRSFGVQLAAAGQSIIVSYRQQAAATLAPVQTGMSSSNLLELIALLEKLVEALPTSGSLQQADQITIKAVRGDRDLARAAQLLAAPPQAQAAAKMKLLGLYRNGELRGVVAVERSPHGRIRGLHLSAEELDPKKALALVRAGLNER